MICLYFSLISFSLIETFENPERRERIFFSVRKTSASIWISYTVGPCDALWMLNLHKWFSLSRCGQLSFSSVHRHTHAHRLTTRSHYHLWPAFALHFVFFFLAMRARKSFFPLCCVQVICPVWLHLMAVRIQIDRWLVNWWPKPQNCMWWNLLHGHNIGTARRYILGHTYCEFHFEFASAVGHRSIFCVVFRLGSGCLILDKLNGMLSSLFILPKFIFFSCCCCSFLKFVSHTTSLNNFDAAEHRCHMLGCCCCCQKLNSIVWHANAVIPIILELLAYSVQRTFVHTHNCCGIITQ